MDVRLPDGTLVKNVPEGTSQEELLATLRDNGHPIPKTWGDQPSTLGNQAGLALRAGVKGVVGLPAMLADAAIVTPVNAGLSALGAKYRLPEQIGAVDSALTSAGVPQPSNATERIVQKVMQALAGSATGVGAGSALAQAPGMTGALGQTLAANPASQFAATGAGTTASATAQEEGASPLHQTIAGLLGSIAPGAIATGAKALGRGAYNIAEPWVIPGGTDSIEGRTLAKMVGDRRPEVINALQTAPREIVPGSIPGASEIASHVGSTELSALAAALAKKYGNSEAYAAGKARDVARDEAVRLAKNPNQMQLRVDRDVARQAEDATMANYGMPATLSKLRELAVPDEPPAMIHRPTMIIRAILERLQGGANTAALQGLTRDMWNDPDKIARLLTEAKLKDKLTALQKLGSAGRTLSAAQLQTLPTIEEQ